MRTSECPDKRFWSRVVKHDGDGCWEWSAAKFPEGYGAVRWGGKAQKAHRLSWLFSFGEIPSGMFVCHRCDNRACVRPDHLFLGSALDNNRDMMAKGRARFKTPLKRSHYFPWRNARLSELTVQRIKIVGKALPGRKMSKLLGLKRGSVTQIVNGKSWKILSTQQALT